MESTTVNLPKTSVPLLICFVYRVYKLEGPYWRDLEVKQALDHLQKRLREEKLLDREEKMEITLPNNMWDYLADFLEDLTGTCEIYKLEMEEWKRYINIYKVPLECIKEKCQPQ